MIASKTRPELYLVIERREDMLSCKHSFPAKATIICQTLKNLSLKLIPELTVMSELNMITGSQAPGLLSSLRLTESESTESPSQSHYCIGNVIRKL